MEIEHGDGGASRSLPQEVPIPGDHASSGDRRQERELGDRKESSGEGGSGSARAADLEKAVLGLCCVGFLVSTSSGAV